MGEIKVTNFWKLDSKKLTFTLQNNFVTGVLPANGRNAEIIPADLIRIMPAKGG